MNRIAAWQATMLTPRHWALLSQLRACIKELYNPWRARLHLLPVRHMAGAATAADANAEDDDPSRYLDSAGQLTFFDEPLEVLKINRYGPAANPGDSSAPQEASSSSTIAGSPALPSFAADLQQELWRSKDREHWARSVKRAVSGLQRHNIAFYKAHKQQLALQKQQEELAKYTFDVADVCKAGRRHAATEPQETELKRRHRQQQRQQQGKAVTSHHQQQQQQQDGVSGVYQEPTSSAQQLAESLPAVQEFQQDGADAVNNLQRGIRHFDRVQRNAIIERLTEQACNKQEQEMAAERRRQRKKQQQQQHQQHQQRLQHSLPGFGAAAGHHQQQQSIAVPAHQALEQYAGQDQGNAGGNGANRRRRKTAITAAAAAATAPSADIPLFDQPSSMFSQAGGSSNNTAGTDMSSSSSSMVGNGEQGGGSSSSRPSITAAAADIAAAAAVVTCVSEHSWRHTRMAILQDMKKDQLVKLACSYGLQQKIKFCRKGEIAEIVAAHEAGKVKHMYASPQPAEQ